MNEILDKVAAGRRPDPARPYPSWTELLAQVGRNTSNSRAVEAPPAREWRDLVADMIVGKR